MQISNQGEHIHCNSRLSWYWTDESEKIAELGQKGHSKGKPWKDQNATAVAAKRFEACCYDREGCSVIYVVLPSTEGHFHEFAFVFFLLLHTKIDEVHREMQMYCSVTTDAKGALKNYSMLCSWQSV